MASLYLSNNLKGDYKGDFILLLLVIFLSDHRDLDLWKAYEESKPTRRTPLKNCNLNEMLQQPGAIPVCATKVHLRAITG